VCRKALLAALNIGAGRPNFDGDMKHAARWALWGNCLALRISEHLSVIPDFSIISTLLELHLTHVNAGFEAFDRWVWDFAHNPSLTVS
jgi:hypothetical protein